MKRFRSLLILCFKLSVSGIIIYIIYSKVDTSALYSAIREIDTTYYLMALLILFSATIASALLMRTILESVGLKKPLRQVFYINFAGYFYSFLGELTGGLVRWYRFSGPDKKGSQAIFAIIVENLLMTSVAYIFLVCGFIISGSAVASPDERHAIITVAVSIGFILVLMYMMLLSRTFTSSTRDLIDTLSARPGLTIIARTIKRLIAPLESFQMDPGVLKAGLSFSLLYQAAGLSAAFLILRSLHITIPIIAVMWIFPAAFFIQKIPVTIYGLGIREGMLIYLLGMYGVAKEQALLIGLLIFGFVILQALAGGSVELIRDINNLRAAGHTGGPRC